MGVIVPPGAAVLTGSGKSCKDALKSFSVSLFSIKSSTQDPPGGGVSSMGW